MNKRIYNFKKADFLCTCIIIAVCLLTLVFNFTSRSASAALSLSIPEIAVILVVIGLFFIPIDSRIKGFTYSLIIFAAAILSLIQDPTLQGSQYTIAASIVVLCLYYSPKLLVAYAVVVDAAYIVIYFIDSKILFGKETTFNYFLSIMLMINAIIIVLYFSNKWGIDIIKKASVKEDEVNKLLTELKTTMEKVEQSSSIMNKNVLTLDSNMDSFVVSSNDTTKTMNEVAKGTQQQAESIYEINTTMTEAISEVNNTKEISLKLKANSGIISRKVEKGTEKINSMSEQMQTINQAVSAALTTVNELQSNIEEINNFLEGISQISEQTNMLSLNASIESARAGEQGKGFAVVADGVKKLATQSAQATDNITGIIKEIQSKTGLAVKTMERTTQEVEEGVVVVNEAGKALGNIISQVKDANVKIQDITKKIEGVSGNSQEVVSMIENVSAVTEETASSAEEISSITEEQTASLEEISASSQSLTKIAEELSKHVSVFKI